MSLIPFGCQHFCGHGGKCEGPYNHGGSLHRSTGAGVLCTWHSSESLTRADADAMLVTRHGFRGAAIIAQAAMMEELFIRYQIRNS